MYYGYYYMSSEIKDLFDPDVKGLLLVDRYITWNETNALKNACFNPLHSDLIYSLQNAPCYPEAEKFIANRKDILQKIIDNARKLVEYCKNYFIHNQESIDLHGSKTRDFYYRRAEDRDLMNTAISEYKTAEPYNKLMDKVYEIENEMDKNFRRFDVTTLNELIGAWDNYPQLLQKIEKSGNEPTIDEVHLSLHIASFLLAFNLVFPKSSK